MLCFWVFVKHALNKHNSNHQTSIFWTFLCLINNFSWFLTMLKLVHVKNSKRLPIIHVCLGDYDGPSIEIYIIHSRHWQYSSHNGEEIANDVSFIIFQWWPIYSDISWPPAKTHLSHIWNWWGKSLNLPLNRSDFRFCFFVAVSGKELNTVQSLDLAFGV